MRRELCLYLPFLQTERLTLAWEPARRKAALLAVTVRRSNTLILSAVSEAAFDAGVRPGMTLAEARAIVPSLESVPRDEAEEGKALHAVAEVVYCYVPHIGLRRPCTLVADATGCERLHGGENRILEKLREGIAAVGYSAQLAIADTSGAALALAVGSGKPVVSSAVGRAMSDVRDIAVASLGLEPATARQLGALGIRTVGQLLDLPSSALPARFGDALPRLLRELRGVDDPVLERWLPPQLIRERVDFDGPTNRRDALVEGLKQAARAVSGRLEARATGARGLRASLRSSDGKPVEFSQSLAVARATGKALSTVLLARFETIDLEERWFDGVELTVLEDEALPETQRELFKAEDSVVRTADIAATVDELAGKLGADAVVRAEMTESPDPQDAFRYVAWGTRSAARRPARRMPAAMPCRVELSEYAVIPGSGPLPRAWDFSGARSALKVIGTSTRFEFGGSRDYLVLEDAAKNRHLVWRDMKSWHVPSQLANRASDLQELDRFGLRRGSNIAPYAELVCATNFSFLRGAGGPAEMVTRAAGLGLHALAITDRHSLAGVVRAHAKAKEVGLRLLIGTRLPLRDGPDLCLYAMNRQGYSNMCRLLTTGKFRTRKGDCELFLADLDAHAQGLHVVVMNAEALADNQLSGLRNLYGDRLSLALMRHFEPGDLHRNNAVWKAGQKHGVAGVAVNDAHACTAGDRLLQAVVTCIREKTTLAEGVGTVFPNGERHLKAPWEMAKLFVAHPEAIARSAEIADACTFSMDELAYEYPDELVPAGIDMQGYLEQQTGIGAKGRYPQGVPEFVATQIEHELSLIRGMGYAAYFLTIFDIVNFARKSRIECQGRGSAANSAVCYCLGITEVPPKAGEQLFERFISRERNEPPDIDVDFEHERREEVLQYIYKKYGRERAGICSTVITYRFRSAVRDAGRVLGYSQDQVGRMAKASEWWDKIERARQTIQESGIDPTDRGVELLLYLVGGLLHAPRHLSQHVGGFVITRGRLDELVAIENAAMKDRTFIEWNKDDIDALRILKVDCLGLGMLAALRRTFDLIEKAGGERLARDKVLLTDPTLEGETPAAQAVYAMLSEADTVGTFQVESRAQMAMLPRLKPQKFYDLVIEVAIVRPGPIQGGMAQKYIKQREAEREGRREPAELHPLLRPILARTKGVPLFQEQVMQIAITAAGYSAGEADLLRRAMGSWREEGIIEPQRKKIVEGMCAKGFTEEYARSIFEQMLGFASYGFPESHAASFALITYVSSYLKRFYPAAFTAALINSQPMGFYSAASLVRDAREHGVRVLPPCVNASNFDCTLEGVGSYSPAPLDSAPESWGAVGPALRLGLHQVRGISEPLGLAVEAARCGRGPFTDLDDFVARIGKQELPQAQRYRLLVQLASADAFAGLGLDRRAALWEVAALRKRSPQLFGDQVRPTPVDLPKMSDFEHMIQDHEILELFLRKHPMEFVRDEEKAKGVITAAEFRAAITGRRVEVAGRIINRQHPETAKGIVFMTLEDETDVANVVVLPDVLERFRRIAISDNMVAIRGQVERVGDVIHLKAASFRSLMARFAGLRTSSRDFH